MAWAMVATYSGRRAHAPIIGGEITIPLAARSSSCRRLASVSPCISAAVVMPSWLRSQTTTSMMASKITSAHHRAVWGECPGGSRGGGVNRCDDGSVVGTIQFRGSGPVQSVWLPAGTLKVKGKIVCASLNSVPFEPCFDLNRTDGQSFRGSVLGMDFAYCNFAHRISTIDRTQPFEPMSLDPTHNR